MVRAADAWSCTAPHADVTQMAMQRLPYRFRLPMPTLLTTCTRMTGSVTCRPRGEQHEQRREETGAGHIANEKWLMTRSSAAMRKR